MRDIYFCELEFLITLVVAIDGFHPFILKEIWCGYHKKKCLYSIKASYTALLHLTLHQRSLIPNLGLVFPFIWKRWTPFIIFSWKQQLFFKIR